MQLLIIKLMGLLGWLSGVALAQTEVSETVTSSVSFPDGGLTCIGNLAIFVTSLLRGRLDLEIAARDVFTSVRGPKLVIINGFGLSTCSNYGDASVVMLTYYTPNSSLSSSVRQFMRYISSAHNVQSILLQCFPLKSVALFTEICDCDETCKCILFYTVDEVTILLVDRMPGKLKRLTDTLCIMLSADCLRNGCHGCNRGRLYVKETDEPGKKRITENDYRVGKATMTEADFKRLPVFDTLDYISRQSIPKERTCICIPVKQAGDDDWTDLLIRSFRSKDKVSREIRVSASHSLQKYMALGTVENFLASDTQKAEEAEIKYSSGSLIVPRFIEICLNLVLTGWFRIDGFSSAVIARRGIRDYLTDSKGDGFGANAFLTGARINVFLTGDGVVSDDVGTEDVGTCHVLTFRGNRLSLKTLSIIGGSVNLICSITWAVLVAVEGGSGKWHYTQSMPPSKPRAAVIITAVVLGLAMDGLHLYFTKSLRPSRLTKPVLMVWALIVLEMVCIVSCIAVAAALGIKGFGRWLYSALQGLVWVKWAIGSYLLGERLPEYDSGPDVTIVNGNSVTRNRTDSGSPWTDSGILVYSSAFLMNAILAGIRGKWEYSQKN